MIELKAELMKKKQEYEESKRSKQNIYTSQNKDLKSNVTRTTQPSSSSSSSSYSSCRSSLEEDQLKNSRKALEAKTRLYNRLERGKLMESDLSAGQRDNLMVDFAWKGWNPETEDFEFDSDTYSDSDIDNDNAKGPLKMDQVVGLLENGQEDKWIEYEDEFGRTRVSKLSQLRQLQADRQEIHQTLYQTSHYDGDAEIRNKGVAFYQFARNEDERQRQMRELKKLREETLERRVRNLILREERRIKIESRLNRFKTRKQTSDNSG